MEAEHGEHGGQQRPTPTQARPARPRQEDEVERFQALRGGSPRRRQSWPWPVREQGAKPLTSSEDWAPLTRVRTRWLQRWKTRVCGQQYRHDHPGGSAAPPPPMAASRRASPPRVRATMPSSAQSASEGRRRRAEGDGGRLERRGRMTKARNSSNCTQPIASGTSTNRSSSRWNSHDAMTDKEQAERSTPANRL